MVFESGYIGRGLDWVKSNSIIGVFLIVSTLMTAGTAVGSAVSILCGMQEQASVLADIAAAFATILLVGLTGSYAISTQKMVRESRIERMRPHITSLISQGIDQMLTEVEHDQNQIDDVDFEAEIPEFCNLRRRRQNENVLIDLRVQNRRVMDQWGRYEDAKNDYLDTRDAVKEEIAELFENEFIEEHDELEFTDFLPEDAEEEDLRSGMVGGDKSIQSMMSMKKETMANVILENSEMPSFDDEDFVGEGEIIHRVFQRYREELLEYRERNEVDEKLEELQNLIRDLSREIDATIPELKEFRADLKSEYEVPEINIDDLDSSRPRPARRR